VRSEDYVVSAVCTLQSREQRKIEAIEKTFEKIEQRQKSGKQQRGAASVNDSEPDKSNRVRAVIVLVCVLVSAAIYWITALALASLLSGLSV